MQGIWHCKELTTSAEKRRRCTRESLCNMCRKRKRALCSYHRKKLSIRRAAVPKPFATVLVHTERSLLREAVAFQGLVSIDENDSRLLEVMDC